MDWHIDDAYGHPEPGFLAMCSAQRPGQHHAPHDHGASWVVYGVYQGVIEQTKWRWVYPEHDRTSAELKPTERYVQRQGEVAFFLPGEIHTTQNVHEGRSLVLRLEAQRLDQVMRHRTNTGQREGADVPQVYLTDAPDGKRLRLLGSSGSSCAPAHHARGAR